MPGLHNLVRFSAGSRSDMDELINFLARSFEPDPDHSPDPVTVTYTGFLNFSGISEEVMDGFR